MPATPGDQIQAGAINLMQCLVIRATARVQDSSVAELARLVELGEQGRAGFVRLADKAAALYVPMVHSLAALTLLGWMFGPALLRALGFEFGDVGIRAALLNAVAVLIVTCPCALGLAVPAVQIPAAVFLGALGLAAFFWSLRAGQCEDLDGAAHRIFIDHGD